MPALRPPQASPVEQVVALMPPVPQQGWPAPPQAAHWLAAVASTQPSAPWQAVGGAPPSTAGTFVGQQS
jgi:hypothetical protein